MNKIVYEHLKASDLPETLRQGIDASATVTVTVQEEPVQASGREHLRKLLDEARKDAPGISTEQAVARIRTLRDEWDE